MMTSCDMAKRIMLYKIILLFMLCLGLSLDIVAQNLPFPAPTHDFHRIIIKFSEGSDVGFTGDGIHSRTDAAVNAVTTALHAPLVAHVKRYFRQSEAELHALRGQLSQSSAEKPLADLNLYYVATLAPQTSLEQARAYLDTLKVMPSVETAYFAPLPAPPASFQIQTPNYVPSQGYRSAAPFGMSVESAWAVAGGRGDSVMFIDLEYAWNYDHEDYGLDVGHLIAGDVYTAFGFVHGTAVMGEVIGTDNGVGISGIAPNAIPRVAASMDGSHYSIAQIILNITAQVPAGSILLIEQQISAPFDVSAACQSIPCDRFVPVETYQDVFDAIRYATNQGIIVVELAGNGSINLDHPVFEGRFKRAMRDSGAILVGAADPNTRLPYYWSNTGSRIDVFAWGSHIYTTGYGDLFTNGLNANQDYTANFAGTSGASAMVAGAALTLQGVANAQGAMLSPSRMRTLLRSTGTPQAASNRKIGAMPNLNYALVTYFNSDGNRLVNKGFENGLVGWKWIATHNDGVICKAGNIAVGACAFRFSGNSGENSRISQKVNFNAGEVNAGATVNLTFSLKANASVSDGVARLVLIYQDGTRQITELPLASTDDIYQTLNSAIIAEKSVKAAKIVFMYRGMTGKAFLDDVKLSVN